MLAALATKKENMRSGHLENSATWKYNSLNDTLKTGNLEKFWSQNHTASSKIFY